MSVLAFEKYIESLSITHDGRSDLINSHAHEYRNNHSLEMESFNNDILNKDRMVMQFNVLRRPPRLAAYETISSFCNVLFSI